MSPRLSHRGFVVGFLAAVVLFMPPPMPAAGETPPPLALVQSGVEGILPIVHSACLGKGADLHSRRDEILQIIDQHLDFDEMAGRTLGRMWKEQPREKQQRFIAFFRQLLFDDYVDRVEECATPATRIVCDRVTVQDEFSTVRTRAVNDGTPVAEIEYRLRLKGTGWQIYDVAVEGVSLVDNYRERFESMPGGKSFDSLLECLKEKVEARAIP